MNNHVMLDVETLGTDVIKRFPIVSIGAVKFDPCGPEIGPNTSLSEKQAFEQVLPLEEQISLGREIDISTLRWWMRQGENARHVFQFDTLYDVRTILQRFREWCIGSTWIWSKSPAFDVVALRSLFEDVDLQWPFSYNRELDVRSVLKLVEPKEGWHPEAPPSHQALDDALVQIQQVQQAYKTLGLSRDGC